MASPIPKPPETRQRRNKAATRTTLQAVPDRGPQSRDLPEAWGEWHEMTKLWWADLWVSPMAPEYDDSDIHGLYMLASLVDIYWKHPTPTLAGEIRHQRQEFGLSPIARRRLQWEIDKGEEAEVKTRKRRNSQAAHAAPADDGPDPRSALA